MGLFDEIESTPASLPKKDNIKAIGFRAEADCVNWAVVTRTDGHLVLIKSDTVRFPNTYDEAHRLEWFRKRLHMTLDDHQPAIGGVRYPEPSAPKSNVTSTNERIRVEGIILEALASKGVKSMTGALKTISSEMGSKSAKSYLTNDTLRGLDWKGKPKNTREAIMVAVAAMEHAEKRSSHGN